MKFDRKGFMAQVAINQGELTDEMSGQASLFASYGFLKIDAEDEEARRKLEREAMEAELDKKIRVKLGDKCTEKAIKAEIIRSPEYAKAEAEYLNAKHASAMLAVAVEAFQMRARMLSSIGALTREEMSQQFVGTPSNSPAAAAAKLAERVKRKLANDES